MNVKNNSFVPGWPILMNVKWQWKNIKNKNAFPPQGDQLTSKTCSLGKLKREMTIVVSGLTSLSHSPHSYIIYIIIFSDHYHIIFSHLFCFFIIFLPPQPLVFLSLLLAFNFVVNQVIDHERDSAYFGTTSGDVIKVVNSFFS